MLLKEIVDCAKYSVVGNSELAVTGVRFAPFAQDTEIGIAYSAEEVKATQAPVVLAPLGLYDTTKTLIYALDMAETALAIALQMIKCGMYPDYRVSPQYTISAQFYRQGSNVVIGKGTTIESFTSIGDDVQIGENCHIGSNVVIGSGVRLGNNVRIGAGAQVGCPASYYYRSESTMEHFHGIYAVCVGNNVEISSSALIERGTYADTLIGDNTVIGDAVCIGHDCVIGKNVYIMAQAGLASKVTVENNVVISGQCGIASGVTLGAGCRLLGKTGTDKNIPPQKCYSGYYAMEHRKELQLLAAMRRLVRR